MERIDSHQHFWHYEPARDGWLTDEMTALRRDFLPADLAPWLQQAGVTGCVAVQSDPSEAETNFLLGLCQGHPFIKGVVGWVDLQAEDVAERLAHYAQFPQLKGFRHLLQGEANRTLMLIPAFRRGLAALAPHGFTFDLLILPDQLAAAAELAGALPNQPLVVDHLAKPPVQTRWREPELTTRWETDIRALAAHPNVCCKVSGLLTEADWMEWQPADFRRYLDTVFDAFGAQRVMFGSDWPVCLLAGSYEQVVDLVGDYVGALTAPEQAAFWAGNATRFYQL